MNDTPQTIIVEQPKRDRSILWLALVAIIVIIVVSWVTCNGYRNGQSQLAASKEIKDVVKRMKEDSIKSAAVIDQLRKDTARTNEAIEDINFNAEILEDSLNRSEVNNRFLALRVKYLSNSFDSGISQENVPLNFVVDTCDKLADAYLAELDVNKAYRKTKDSLQEAMKLRIKQGDSISVELDSVRQRHIQSIGEFMSIIGVLKPHVNVKLGISGVYSPFLIGGGPAIVLEDKKRRQYGASVIFTNHGKLYEGKVLFPISFRKR